ncbi:hypothetical protein V6N13_062372 [Hibiscus sabdariffa]|uniref:RDRP C-terminal head domain-containing protein n=1 Tax=Hibiscus sabdariffa TaxID=183260 RepID=A0ABR2NJ86_9ROSI
MQLVGLLEQYKVNREEAQSFLWCPEERIRQNFENMDSNFEQLNEDEKNLSYERKASAWYQATYSLQKPDGGGSVLMLSFAWIVSDYHGREKVRRR